MQTSFTWHRTNGGQIFDRLNIRAFRRSVNRTGQKFERHNLSQIFSRFGQKFDQRDLNTITMAVRVQIPITWKDSGFLEQNHRFKIPRFRIPQANCFSDSGIPNTYLTWRETTAINKQTKTITWYGAPVDRSHTIRSIRQFRYLSDDQKIDSETIDVLLLENEKEQKRNNEMPKGTRLGKTEQDTAFR